MLGILPLIQYVYDFGEVTLDYADNEKDLGVIINCKLNFNEQCEKVYSRANQRFGLTKRICYFVNDIRRKRILYLSLIRSQFEHCSSIWRPTGRTMLNKMENLQKRCIKWILAEEFLGYQCWETYVLKCRQVDILPICKRFEFNDLVLFYKVLNGLIPLQMPEYLKFFDGNTRLRSCHLDHLSLVSDIGPLKKSFFYRTHHEWNRLPLELRSVQSITVFKHNLLKFLWSSVLEETEFDSDIEAEP